jgi:hypothetical protein
MLLTTLSALLVLLFLGMVGGIWLGLIFLCLIVASVVLISLQPDSQHAVT